MLLSHSPYAWQADVDTTVVIPALSLLYLFAVGRFGASGAHVAAFGGAMSLLAVAFWSARRPYGWAVAVAVSVLASPRLLLYQVSSLVAGTRAPDDR